MLPKRRKSSSQGIGSTPTTETHSGFGAYNPLGELLTPEWREERDQHGMAMASETIGVFDYQLPPSSMSTSGATDSVLAHAFTPNCDPASDFMITDDWEITCPRTRNWTDMLLSLGEGPVAVAGDAFWLPMDKCWTTEKVTDTITPPALAMPADHPTSCPTAAETLDWERPGYNLIVPPEVADELIDVYFKKIQAFLPIFRQSKFYSEFLNNAIAHGQRYLNLPRVSEFLLNAMFALSARFSTAPSFSEQDPVNRGNRFMERATMLWEEMCRDQRDSIPTLECLQGLILLTFTVLQRGPSSQAWSLCGACCRLAYDLDLHNVDLDIVSGKCDQSSLSLDECLLREEKRRAWWMIWEMDTFASALSGRPFAIDARRMSVLLSVSDKAWFENQRVPSVPLDTSTGMAWKELCDCPNQDERAWFLVSLSILRQISEALLAPTPRKQALQDVEAVIGCFVLALPETFHVGSGSILFDDHNFSRNNWVICTLVVIQW